MKPKKGEEIVIKIDSLVYGGNGIGKVEGFKVFVDNVCVGDTARVRILRVKSHYAEAKLLEIVKESKLRIKPKCKHFGVCGGCKWQFLPYEEQTKIKEEQVRDSVTRLAGLDGDLVKPIIACEEPFFYRNKTELSFAKGKLGEAELGFYPIGWHFEVCNLEECFLQSPAVAKIVKIVRDFANGEGVSVYDSHKNSGALKELTIREGKNTGERMVILTVTANEFEHQAEFIKLFEGGEIDGMNVNSLYLRSIRQVKGSRTEVKNTLLYGKKTISETLKLGDGKELKFEILPDAFFQTNTLQAQVLYSKVIEIAGLSGKETVFDLYCGTGTIGLFCAGMAKKVVGVEINESAVENARANAVKNGIENVEFYLGSVEDKLSSLQEKPDTIIVDPPRSGLGDSVVETICKFGAKKIVYVSCNPSTMARDLKTFVGFGYKTNLVQPVDMFPQTHHSECITLIEKYE